jgi:hypothetical protein
VTAMTKDDLADFATALLMNRKVIENALGVDVRADVREKPVTSLNAILRMIGLRVRNTRRRRVNGRIVREYAFDRAAYGRILKIVERRRTKEGWRTLYEMHGWDTRELGVSLDDQDADATPSGHRRRRRVESPQPRQDEAVKSTTALALLLEASQEPQAIPGDARVTAIHP